MNRWFRLFLCTAVSVFMLETAVSVSADARQNDLFPVVRNIDLLSEVYQEVSENYVDPVDPSEFMFAGIDGMLETLDPYTVFLDREKSVELGEITSGQYGGVGLTIAGIGDDVFVVSLVEGFSADKAGLRIGDQITRIDGKEVSADSLETVKNLLKGVPGTSVDISVRRCGLKSPFSLNLTRQEIRVNTIGHASLIGETGYFEMNSFGNNSTSELVAAIESLRAEAARTGGRMSSVILDLRNNPGGLLDVAVDITGIFVRKGSQVVSIRGRGPESDNSYVTKNDPVVGELPLVVLINKRSASASEIVAGAIQELDRGLVIGERSFGKGLVQSIIPLPYDCKLKMTSARYYTPSGRLIQKYHEQKEESRSVLEHTGRQDSTKVFYTLKNRRKVYGGGGILPDILVSDTEAGEYEKALNEEGMVFRYACRFHSDHPEKPRIPMDRATLLAGFSAFLDEKEFSFRAEPVWLFDSMKSSAENFGSSARLDSLLGLVRAEMEVLLERQTGDEEERIAALLEQEIIRHYDEDVSRNLAVSKDPVVKKALEVLLSQKRYKELLEP
ncbi:MAG TPA: S41 family peptidase [Prosthecochloris aestuarii]|uniref:S41 family peptidase n=1 Tax=Prosthecochloris aestuarii TaxID=1102 RepID=A0A831SVV9_PROAE|nr:S41 family peptidase [Prosthecochloris aestuarii]